MAHVIKNREEIEAIVVKQISGNANDDETEMIEEWICENEENKRFYFDIEMSWRLSKPLDSVIDVYAASLKIKKQMFSKLHHI